MEADLKQIEWEDVDWINLAQHRDRWQASVKTAMNHRAQYNAVNLLTS